MCHYGQAAHYQVLDLMLIQSTHDRFDTGLFHAVTPSYQYLSRFGANRFTSFQATLSCRAPSSHPSWFIRRIASHPYPLGRTSNVGANEGAAHGQELPVPLGRRGG